MKRPSRAAGPVVLAAVALAAAGARADFDPEAWRWSRDVLVPEGAAAPHARLALPAEVWDQAAGPALQDLRVLRGETDEVGYAVYVPARPASRIEERAARVLNRAKRGTEASELVVDLGDPPPVTNGIRLESPALDFRCPVAIEGSDDAKAWKTLRADGAIFAFAGDVERRFTAVRFPDARLRYLRAVVGAPPGGEPIDLAGAAVFQEVETGPGDLPLLVERAVRARTETEQDRQTHYTLDLGARHLPVSRIVVETDAQDFWRTVAVDAGDDLKALRHAGRGVVFRYRTARYLEERLAVDFGEAFGRYVRVRVVHGDDAPLAVRRIAVFGRPRYVCFPFEPGHRYRLFYGNLWARAGTYDYARTLAALGPAAAMEVRLGEARANPRFIATREAAPPHPWIVRNQWVLYVALAAAVVGLVAVALRSLRRPAGADEAGPE